MGVFLLRLVICTELLVKRFANYAVKVIGLL